MFVCITERNGNIHIIDYFISKAQAYVAICEKSVKIYAANTFAADNTFPGMCSRCEKMYHEMYIDDLNCSTSMARSSVNTGLVRDLILKEMQLDTPETKYSYCVNRGWRKLGKLRRNIINRRR